MIDYSDLSNPMGNNADAGAIPKKDEHLKRFPFVVLMDISGSTNQGADPDIRYINRAINELVKTVKNPPADSEFKSQSRKIDLCILTYAMTVNVVQDWSVAEQLPSVIAEQKAGGSTHTVAALTKAFDKIAERVRYYKANKILHGAGAVFHLTDGCLKDGTPGSEQWKELQSRIKSLGTPMIGAKGARVPLFNFLSPGFDTNDTVEIEGKIWDGRRLLESLMGGNEAIDDLKNELDSKDSFARFLRTVSAVMVGMSRDMEADEAFSRAKDNETPKPKSKGDGASETLNPTDVPE